MDLVVDHVVQFQIMHVPDGNRRIEILACSSVAKLNLSVAAYRNAFPFLLVIEMFLWLFNDIVRNDPRVFLLEILKVGIGIIICHLKKILDILFVCAVKYGSLDIKPEYLCRK